MKLSSIVLALCVAFLFSCASEPAENTETTTGSAPETSGEASAAPAQPAAGGSAAARAIKDEMDTYTDQFDEAHKRAETRPVRPNFYSKDDRMGVIEKDGQIQRVVGTFFPPGSQTRSIFYAKDGRLALWKHRQWYKEGDKPHAVEIACYVGEDGLLTAWQRTVDLRPGENPGPLLAQAETEVTTGLDSLYRVAMSEWERVKKAAEASK